MSNPTLASADSTIIVGFAHTDDDNSVWVHPFQINRGQDVGKFLVREVKKYLKQLDRNNDPEENYYSEETAVNYNVLAIIHGHVNVKWTVGVDERDSMLQGLNVPTL